MALIQTLLGAGFSSGQAQALQGASAPLTSTSSSSATGATPLAVTVNPLNSVTGGNSYILPSTAQGSILGDTLYVGCLHASTASAIVYPASGETINNAASLTVAADKMAILVRNTANAWNAIVTA